VLLPTERLGRITPRQINLRFAVIRDGADLACRSAPPADY
jgi:hypothetical protein